MSPIKKTRRPTTSAPALLAVDVGNSETGIAVFQDEQIVLHWRVRSVPRTPDETQFLLRQYLAPEAIDLAGLPAVLCSVVPAVTPDFAAAIGRVTGTAPVIVTARSVPSMAIRYHDPEQVGPDRLANAVAARERYGAPAIVVDVGTATTFDVVGADGDFLGGAITAGMGLTADVLASRTARLGRVELSAPEHAIGRTTAESLRSGIVLGHAALVDGMVSRILAELGGRAHVVATGGLAFLLREHTGTIEQFDEGLTLEGLRLIHESVAHPETLAAWAKKQEGRRAARARSVAAIEHEPALHFDDEVEEVRDARPPRPTRPSRTTRGSRVTAAKPVPTPAPAQAAATAIAPAPAADAGNGGRKRRRGRRGGRRPRR